MRGEKSLFSVQHLKLLTFSALYNDFETKLYVALHRFLKFIPWGRLDHCQVPLFFFHSVCFDFLYFRKRIPKYTCIYIYIFQIFVCMELPGNMHFNELRYFFSLRFYIYDSSLIKHTHTFLTLHSF